MYLSSLSFTLSPSPPLFLVSLSLPLPAVMVDAVAEEGDFLQAIERYTEAISLNRNNHLLFYNRSAAYARVGKFAEALEDAKRCHELKPDWPKVKTVI